MIVLIVYRHGFFALVAVWLKVVTFGFSRSISVLVLAFLLLEKCIFVIICGVRVIWWFGFILLLLGFGFLCTIGKDLVLDCLLTIAFFIIIILFLFLFLIVEWWSLVNCFFFSLYSSEICGLWVLWFFGMGLSCNLLSLYYKYLL